MELFLKNIEDLQLLSLEEAQSLKKNTYDVKGDLCQIMQHPKDKHVLGFYKISAAVEYHNEIQLSKDEKSKTVKTFYSPIPFSKK